MLIYVRWLDAVQPVSEWTLCTAIEPGLMECESVGWIVSQSDSAIVLAGNIADHGTDSYQCAGFIQIPKSAVTAWAYLATDTLMLGAELIPPNK